MIPQTTALCYFHFRKRNLYSFDWFVVIACREEQGIYLFEILIGKNTVSQAVAFGHTHYNKNSAFNSRNGTFGTGPDLHGISGCGLWYTDPMHLISGTVKPKITAIMTDWPVKDRSVIIGTRIDVITGIIKKYLEVDFPESQIVRVH